MFSSNILRQADFGIFTHLYIVHGFLPEMGRFFVIFFFLKIFFNVLFMNQYKWLWLKPQIIISCLKICLCVHMSMHAHMSVHAYMSMHAHMSGHAVCQQYGDSDGRRKWVKASYGSHLVTHPLYTHHSLHNSHSLTTSYAHKVTASGM